jgi:hypothetical protein
MIHRWWSIAACAVIFAGILSGSAVAATASWNAVTSDGVAGYALYQAPGACDVAVTYDKVIVYGLVTSGPIPTPADGTYCYAVTAFDVLGQESEYSNRVEFTFVTPPVCLAESYCRTLKGLARKQCLACR